MNKDIFEALVKMVVSYRKILPKLEIQNLYSIIETQFALNVYDILSLRKSFLTPITIRIRVKYFVTVHPACVKLSVVESSFYKVWSFLVIS